MAWYDANWQYRKKLSIDNSKIDSALTDFPVVVILRSSNFDFSKAKSDGTDIRFTASDGTTELKYERARYDNGSSEAEFWVKIPSVSSSADTEFYIYYGYASATDGQDTANTWESNFKGVFHLEQGNANAADSIGTNTLTKTGTLSQTTGQVGKAVSGFSGSNYLAKSSGATVFSTGNADRALVFSVYFNSLPSSDWQESYTVMVGTWTTNQMSSAIIGQYSSVKNWNAALYANDVLIANTPSLNTWLRVAFVYTASNKTTTIYVNGTSIGSGAHGSNSNFSNAAIGIGNNGQTLFAYPIDGYMDEVFLYNAAPSAAWVKADSNSVNDTLLTYGSEETAATPNTTNFFLMFT